MHKYLQNDAYSHWLSRASYVAMSELQNCIESDELKHSEVEYCSYK